MRQPKIGDRVLYTYQPSDLDKDHQARVGDVRPATITNVFSANCCNLSVDADFANDGFPGGKFWATSRPQSEDGSKQYHFHYPEPLGCEHFEVTRLLRIIKSDNVALPIQVQELIDVGAIEVEEDALVFVRRAEDGEDVRLRAGVDHVIVLGDPVFPLHKRNPRFLDLVQNGMGPGWIWAPKGEE